MLEKDKLIAHLQQRLFQLNQDRCQLNYCNNNISNYSNNNHYNDNTKMIKMKKL